MRKSYSTIKKNVFPVLFFFKVEYLSCPFQAEIPLLSNQSQGRSPLPPSPSRTDSLMTWWLHYSRTRDNRDDDDALTFPHFFLMTYKCCFWEKFAKLTASLTEFNCTLSISPKDFVSAATTSPSTSLSFCSSLPPQKKEREKDKNSAQVFTSRQGEGGNHSWWLRRQFYPDPGWKEKESAEQGFLTCGSPPKNGSPVAKIVQYSRTCSSGIFKLFFA